MSGLNIDRIILYFSLVFVIVGGIVYSFILGDQIRFRDEGHYLKIANNVIKHSIYSYDDNAIIPTTFHPPGYPLILASIVSIGGGFFAIRMVNFFFLACCIVLLTAILRKHGFVVGAQWVPLIVLCYPVLFFTASTLYPQIIATAIFLFIIYMIDAFSLSLGKAFIVGVLYGLLLMISPSFVLMGPVFLATPYILRKSVPRLYIIGLIVGVVVVLTPWVVRNYLVFDRLVILSSNAGKTFILGNSENSKPNEGEIVDVSRYTDEIKRKGLDEIDGDKYYKQKAFEWIKNNPQDASILYLRKLLNYFNFRNDLATRTEQSVLRDVIMFITYYCILLFALFRFYLIKRFPMQRIEIFLLIVYLMSAVMNAFFLPRIRYRLPYDVLLICFSAITLDYLIGLLSKKSFNVRENDT
ncbi:MAG: hypothetical protein APG08_01545 [Candidatus Methanofastidiosum methylothiophilum]|uniref:Uncharacterized protein n=1 Tax=Candidatus Methanofastidiosum methylothiophilum TaxID=1705564 RepID=A0A150J7A7_9EURY|nr:MAG: hypothetical protein AN188_01505 [Candidatus Methanofastidiosum methylthiophilus]MBP7089763.1 hypothetical protein [Syntrophorhabdaceae bacterium]MDI9561946.1 hypothetical protein [Pseudomonadota bacterium]OQC49001.1 MAG: hypothetical protein BWX58_00869 [Deltaproteobacteria bacterium ADurb.Bin026]KYC55624.1 MAG: hypothetical protein APG08_01545 [Candidatus Methanofastidiosum methylthiophilus]